MKLTKLMASAALAVAAATASFAEENLVISSWLPPAHPINTEMLQGLADMMAEATGGEVTAEIKMGLAPPPAQMDLVMDGAADVTIIFHGYQPGRFVATKLIELPGYEGNAEAASVAYWRVHEAHLAQIDEHRGVKLIGLTTHGPGQIHSNKEVATLDDLNGLKTRLGGGVSADVGAELGLVGIQVPAPKVYETLDSGAADAVAMNMGERISFKLNEVAKNVYEMPGGFYRGSFAVLMSQERFDSLPEAAQKALEDNVFGEPFSRMMGKAWDVSDDSAREATLAAGDNKIVTASGEDQAKFAEMAARVREKILAEIAETGIDAQAAYEMVKAEMAKASM
ncbi:TRAP-type C4-dicarboxylate transport system, substrate-binding protein [Lutimaribacter pacificus]|uniref:TRAP-type C4-dicarboxylate transport system, substrate-binding protein n=1 Tax=Lutimaribacter pacificus TaxID=391948 RepID=A0A1H0HR32_9RHOB|nr:TRAP transporter substrate-binding protein [Lutimaribacter pacificus]SDO21616.1 TRAP-type C4-dicarboxylate transport system, substrate-binding protein [Lutimaribacter pacificus]SHK32274.1 TRAP-type C4-dicarboxylate transport system, substrate-binding protein [Lutimaribacter pacificus]